MFAVLDGVWIGNGEEPGEQIDRQQRAGHRPGERRFVQWSRVRCRGRSSPLVRAAKRLASKRQRSSFLGSVLGARASRLPCDRPLHIERDSAASSALDRFTRRSETVLRAGRIPDSSERVRLSARGRRGGGEALRQEEAKILKEYLRHGAVNRGGKNVMSSVALAAWPAAE